MQNCILITKIIGSKFNKLQILICLIINLLLRKIFNLANFRIDSEPNFSGLMNIYYIILLEQLLLD